MSTGRPPWPHSDGLPQFLWAPVAWIEGRWQPRVLLEIDRRGCWSAIEPHRDPPDEARHLPGPLLPGMVNAHSHAFQRGFAGLTERRAGERDDFWSWREGMYSLALRITPAHLRAIAAQLYSELLEGGYTQVCEFHYLHHDRDGRPHADPLAMSRALAEAAVEVGIGLTLLPVLYQRAGFGQPALGDRQRRFRSTAIEVLGMRDAIRGWRLPNVSAGVAIHSLRAASPEAIAELAQASASDPGPIHIHVAEQAAEVRDCLASTGMRPLAWLARHAPLDARWQIVHATHADRGDIAAIAATGAGVIVCPSTEADLGDGRFDLPQWRAASVPMAIGSDSHVGRHWPHELRLLEYGQRLALERRNVGAAPELGQPSTAEALFAQALSAGAAAAGFSGEVPWGLCTGARADAVVLDPQISGLLAIRDESLLDAAVFACDRPPFAEVWVAGVPRVTHGRHQDGAGLAAQYVETLHQLAQDTA